MLRLDKYLANHGGLTRAEARIAIQSGIVTVNGDMVKAIGQKVQESDSIFVLSQEVLLGGETYLVFHKPAGIICSNKDAEHSTVIDLIPDYDDLDLSIAGRLDKDTTGIVLLSTDGKWTHRVTSPNYKSKKTYLIETADPIAPELVGRFREGIFLKDSPKLTAPAELEILSEKVAKLVLTEGRYHQVKRMFGACGNKVVKLHRSRVGIVDLDGLEEGQCRVLTDEEIASFDGKS